MKKVLRKIAPRTYQRLGNVKATLRETSSAVNRIEAQLGQGHDSRLDLLKKAYAIVDPYQPLYGVSGFGKEQRPTHDRSEAIYKYYDSDVRGVRFLDVGCYFGYLSFYLADRGASVDGWDYRPENIEVCNRLKDVIGVPVDFQAKNFSPKTIETIDYGQYDAVLILSVLHWTIYEKGLEYVQDCMVAIFEKVPVVILELAQKHEDKKLYWDKAVPEKDLDIFKKVKDIEIEKIGEFPTHLTDKKRPIYVVTKKHLEVNGKRYAVDKYFVRAYKDAPAWRPIGTTYYLAKSAFIKQYNYASLTDQTTRQMMNEINFLLQNESTHNPTHSPNVPKLLDFEIKNTYARLVFDRIDGQLLDEHAAGGLAIKRVERLAKQLLKTLASLEKRKFQHNDIRSWNIIVTKKDKIYLTDFELVSTESIEDNYVAFLWVINVMLTGRRESFERQKTNLPPKAAFKGSHLLMALYKAYKPGDSEQFIKFEKLL